MDCYSFDKVLSDYIDSNLSVKQQQEAKEHIAACPGCREKLADMVNMLNTLRSLPACCVRPGFEARLMARIARGKQKKEMPFANMLREYARVISVAAAVMLLFATSLFVYTSVVLPGHNAAPPAAEIRSIEPAPAAPLAPRQELPTTGSEK
ncbi:MAG: zf-HC2 domain-containing protein, partial [FCB group bacterium]|nr:zf-HC2 domain-containing protein [FCB group bacterium]